MVTRNDLLARIAQENSGDFPYVPTTSGGAQVHAAATGTNAVAASLAAELLNQGVSESDAAQFASMVSPASTYLPGGLGQREAYDYQQADATGASRVAYNAYVGVAEGAWQVQGANVSPADNTLTPVSSSKEGEYGTCGWQRVVQVLRPGGTPRAWIPISPAGSIPENWDVRNSPYHDVLYVSDPEPGTWQIRTRVYYALCQQGQGIRPSSTDEVLVDFVQTGTVLSTTKVEGQILLEDNQGNAGDPVPLLATVLTRAGATPGAFLIVAVERPGVGPGPRDDQDDDGIPTWWEKLYTCMDPDQDHSQRFDCDEDGLTNWEELLNGTDPCDPDTDDGDEMDGSEVARQRNPLWPGDDVVPPVYQWSVRPLNQAIVVRWNHPFTYARMHIAITGPDGQTDTYDGAPAARSRSACGTTPSTPSRPEATQRRAKAGPPSRRR